jgi:hypothetical protein
MSFEWGGTFTVSQFNRLRDYIRSQATQIDARIKHLQAERDRIGDLAFAYDAGGVPTDMEADIPLTYVGKLFSAYEALGGDAEFDLQMRSTSQPVFRLAGDVTKPAQLMSNGEVINTPGLSDAESAKVIQKLRGGFSGDLQRRRYSLERKIRRAIDYSEQLDVEISQLKLLQSSAETNGSVENLISIINVLASNPQYYAVTDDGGQDPHGKFARAPIAGYTPGEKGASAVSYERTRNGLVKPTE